MELKPNMYVRSKINGMISKITDIEQFEELGQIVERYILDNNYNVGFCSTEKDSVIASYNIIDLIEVGDYVNGWRVNRVEKEEDGVMLTIGTITSFVSKNEKEPYLTKYYDEPDKMCKFKSIVTKEQFSQMEYKVDDAK